MLSFRVPAETDIGIMTNTRNKNRQWQDAIISLWFLQEEVSYFDNELMGSNHQTTNYESTYE